MIPSYKDCVDGVIFLILKIYYYKVLLRPFNFYLEHFFLSLTLFYLLIYSIFEKNTNFFQRVISSPKSGTKVQRNTYPLFQSKV